MQLRSRGHSAAQSKVRVGFVTRRAPCLPTPTPELHQPPSIWNPTLALGGRGGGVPTPAGWPGHPQDTCGEVQGLTRPASVTPFLCRVPELV